MNRSVPYALGAAALFGVSTPFAKLLLGEVSPWVLAAVLYLGSGIGLAAWIALRAHLPGRAAVAPIPRPDWPWLAAAIAAGGIAGPVLLMQGLARTDAASASLLLNLETVLTAAIAWTVFRENVDRRVFAGMVAIVAGGVLLSAEAAPRAGGFAGALLVAAACLAWAIDNNLTRRVSGGDAATLACVKGLAAGVVNLALAWILGAPFPAVSGWIAAGRHASGRARRRRHLPKASGADAGREPPDRQDRQRCGHSLCGPRKLALAALVSRDEASVGCGRAGRTVLDRRAHAHG
jgi:drug/metabolite transporter (DMT)-like permease